MRRRLGRAVSGDRGPEFAPPGHYYSPVPDIQELARGEQDVWRPRAPEELADVALDEQGQLAFLDRIAALVAEGGLPHEWGQATTGLVYRYDNPFYGPGDALFLYGMLRDEMWGRAERIIEVGSGWSTAVMLDVSRRHYDDRLAITCIEPYPERLLGLLGDGGEGRVRLERLPVQQVGIDLFRQLREGDILFIDSSHVSKCGSDVNYLILDVLPRLPRGVRVHVHDVFYPFEYPREWVVTEGRAFNEDYLLRAFLAFNSVYEILAWNSLLVALYPDRFAHALPQAASNAGASIWLHRR